MNRSERSISFLFNAEPHQAFAPDAFAAALGQPFTFEDTTGTLLDAVVAEDGRSVILTIEIPW